MKWFQCSGVGSPKGAFFFSLEITGEKCSLWLQPVSLGPAGQNLLGMCPAHCRGALPTLKLGKPLQEVIPILLFAEDPSG